VKREKEQSANDAKKEVESGLRNPLAAEMLRDSLSQATRRLAAWSLLSNTVEVAKDMVEPSVQENANDAEEKEKENANDAEEKEKGECERC